MLGVEKSDWTLVSQGTRPSESSINFKYEKYPWKMGMAVSEC